MADARFRSHSLRPASSGPIDNLHSGVSDVTSADVGADECGAAMSDDLVAASIILAVRSTNWNPSQAEHFPDDSRSAKLLKDVSSDYQPDRLTVRQTNVSTRPAIPAVDSIPLMLPRSAERQRKVWIAW